MSDRAFFDAYDFDLPETSIAQRPLPRRVRSRLLCWHADGSFSHRHFGDLLELVDPRDLIVLNDTRVFPARLWGTKRDGSARVEILLVRPRPEIDAHTWEALVRPGRRVPPSTVVDLDGEASVVVGERSDDQTAWVHFPADLDVLAHCRRHGHVPLPPYIERSDDAGDHERYQTVFARHEGSVAAPTAGLHFDAELLAALRARGVRIATVTLHVGPGTFRPPDAQALATGQLHPEWREVPTSTLEALHACRARGGRVIAVGTTVCRTLESLPPDAEEGVFGDTRLFLRPGHRWQWCDVLVTNFHLPRSSLLVLVDAFAGDRWREAYAIAIREGYRFYSYGDGNWIERRPEGRA